MPGWHFPGVFLQVKSKLINCSAPSAAKGAGSTWGETPAALRNGPGVPVTFPQRCQRDTGNRKPAGFIGQLNQASAEPFQLLSAEPQHSAGLFATTAPTQSPGQGELPPSHSVNSARLSVLLLRAEHLENVPRAKQSQSEPWLCSGRKGAEPARPWCSVAAGSKGHCSQNQSLLQHERAVLQTSGNISLLR